MPILDIPIGIGTSEGTKVTYSEIFFAALNKVSYITYGSSLVIWSCDEVGTYLSQTWGIGIPIGVPKVPPLLPYVGMYVFKVSKHL